LRTMKEVMKIEEAKDLVYEPTGHGDFDCNFLLTKDDNSMLLNLVDIL